MTDPDTPLGGVGPGEERHYGAGFPRRVAVVQVVAKRVVEVDRLLHQPQAQEARVEVHVLLRVARDGGDVVYAREPNLLHPVLLPVGRRRGTVYSRRAGLLDADLGRA